MRRLGRSMALLGVLMEAWSLARPAPVTLAAVPQIWRDESGGAFDLGALRGHPVVVTMAYASCRRVCPTTMQSLRKVQRALDDHGVAADVIIVGYDPKDDPSVWQRYRQKQGLVYPNWHFLSGAEPDIRRFASLLGFDFWMYDEHVMHDFKIVFIDPQGEVVAGLSWSSRNEALLSQAAAACHFLNPNGSCPQ